MEGLIALAFFALWVWVIFAGIKAVFRRITSFLVSPFERMGDTEVVYPKRQLIPMAATALDPDPIWTNSEQRQFGRKLASATEVSPQAIVSEMERELGRLVQHAASVEGNLARFTEELDAIEKAQADWTERAGLAVEKGRDMLARAALAEKNKLAPRAAAIRADAVRLEDLLDGYRRDIVALETKLSESVRRTVVAKSRLDGAEAKARARELVYGQRTAAAFASLDQVEKAADAAEGEADALALGQNRDLASEIDALVADDDIDRELAALKQKLGKAA